MVVTTQFDWLRQNAHGARRVAHSFVQPLNVQLPLVVPVIELTAMDMSTNVKSNIFPVFPEQISGRISDGYYVLASSFDSVQLSLLARHLTEARERHFHYSRQCHAYGIPATDTLNSRSLSSCTKSSSLKRLYDFVPEGVCKNVPFLTGSDIRYWRQIVARAQ